MATLEVNKMKVNHSKTERALLVQGSTNVTDVKMLGNYICSAKEMEHRKELVKGAFGSMADVWKSRDEIDTKTRVFLYKMFIRPNFTYNIGAATYTKSQLEELEALDRRQLRRVVGIFYPVHIQNEKLHEITNTMTLTELFVQGRWQALGHLLRLPGGTPSNNAMNQFTEGPELMEGEEAPGVRLDRSGRLTTLPMLINEDLQKITDWRKRKALFGVLRLQTRADLDILRIVAADRDKWIVGWTAIVGASKVLWLESERNKSALREAAALRREEREMDITGSAGDV